MIRRIALAALLFICSSTSLAQDHENIDLIGRWGNGPCLTSYSSGDVLYTGNGIHLDIYYIDETERAARYSFSDVVQDVFVYRRNAFVAVRDYGVFILDVQNPSEPVLIGSRHTGGEALKVQYNDPYIFMADGEEGLTIIDPAGMEIVSQLELGSDVLDVDIKNGMVLLAADDLGLVSVDVSDPFNLVISDTLDTPGSAGSIFIHDGLAFLTVDTDGLWRVDVSNPDSLSGANVLNRAGLVDVYVDLFGITAYLADRDYGLCIFNLSTLTEANTLALDGQMMSIHLDAYYVYLSTYEQGASVVKLSPLAEQYHLQSGGMARDVLMDNPYIYVAGGESGLWLLGPPDDDDAMMDTRAHRNTDNAYGLALGGVHLYVADGSGGLRVFNVDNPLELQDLGAVGVGNFAYDVAILGDSAYVADGNSGLTIFDISDPSNPVFDQTIPLGVNPTIGVAVDADSGYVYAASGADGVQLLDANTMTLRGKFVDGTIDAQRLAVAGGENPVVQVADGSNGLRTLDFSDADNPVEADVQDTDGFAHDVALKNGSAFIADGEGTVRMIDLSGEMNEVGVYHTVDVSLGVDVQADTLAVADGEGGVYLLRPRFLAQFQAVEDSLAFENVVIGYSRDRRLHLINTGTTPVGVTNITSNTGRFTFNSNEFNIPPQDTITVFVTFTPLYAQFSDDIVTVYSNASNSPLEIPVSGTGITRMAAGPYVPDYYAYTLFHMDQFVWPWLYDYSLYGYLDGFATGAVTLHGLGRYGSCLHFENDGVITVPPDSLDFLPEFEGFSVDMWLNPDTTWTGGGILYQLSQAGQIIFQLSVDSDSQLVARMGLNTLKSGTGWRIPANAWSHAALTYDTVLSLFFNGVLVDTLTVGMIDPSGVLSMTLGNDPTLGNVFTGRIDEFRMSGIAREPWEFPQTYPKFDAQPQSIAFGNVRVGTTGTRTVAISNHGYQAMNIIDMNWTHEEITVSNTAFTLVSEATLTDTLTFTPNGIGAVFDTLSIQTNDPDQPTVEIPISANGVQGPILATATESLDFGRIAIGNAVQRDFVITNNGDDALVVTDLQWTNTLFDASVNAFTVLPAANRQVTMTFSPEISGIYRDTLSIVSNTSVGGTVRIPMVGYAFNYREKAPYAVDPYTIALYHFENANVDTAFNSVGPAYPGVLQGGADKVADGYFSRGLLLNGVNGRVRVANAAALSFDMATDDFTVECLFKTDTVSQALIFKDLFGGATKANYGLMINEEGRVNAYGFGTGLTKVNDDAWHHLGFIYESSPGRGRLLIDGAVELTSLWTAGATDTQNPSALLMGAREFAAGDYRNNYEGMLDEVRISSIARDPMEIAMAPTGVQVDLGGTPVAGVVKGVTIDIPYNPTTQSVTLYYRPGGTATYTALAATEQDSVTYTTQIPADAVVWRGLEYYASVTTGQGTLTEPLYDPENHPLTSVVRFTGATSNALQALRYTMISVPGDLDAPATEDVLSDDFNDYDPREWRCFAWMDTGYVEFSDTLDALIEPRFDLNRGRAFWVIPKEEKTFDIGAGYSPDPGEAFTYTLRPQWNMIGSPYPYTVAWDDCSVASDSIGTLYYYDGTGYRLDWAVFDPWGGYWIYNRHLINTRFSVLPQETAALAKPSMSKQSVLYALEDSEWIWVLSAEASEARDLDNFAGVRMGASNGWDTYDRAEPPPIGDYVTVYFPDENPHSTVGSFAADIRQPGAEGYRWNVVIESRLADEPLSLTWKLRKNLPEGWSAYLIDETDGVSTEMFTHPTYVYRTSANRPNVRHFTLLVGPTEFMEGQTDVPLMPYHFHLFQNYPNPFNPATTITYSIPRNGQVRLTVYNVMGQAVRRLVNEAQKTGEHDVIWDGLNEVGQRVPSGMYIYRLDMSGQTAVRKLILLK